MTNKAYTAHLKLILAMFFWSGTYHAAKYVVDALDIYTASAIRWGMASAIFMALLLMKHKPSFVFTQFKRHWLLIIGIGFFSICLYSILFFAAEGLLPGNLVAIIMSLTPCLTVIFSRFFLKERPNLLTAIGIIIAFCGTIFAINLSEFGCGDLWCSDLLHSLNYGMLVAFFMTFAMAAYGLLFKKATNAGADTLTITALSSVAGAIFLLIIAAFEGNYMMVTFLSLNDWLAMLYLVIFGSVIGYKWYSEGIKAVKLNQAIVFINTIPILSIIIGVLFFNAHVTGLFVASAVVVVIGVIITDRSLRGIR